ncbi:hypothetical protein BCR42DRAFT_402539 [Absidia repens]|uniref:Uncharacterized protein n=1 Tax=Absidia repens TaxID=90262 RepID=A0A1X2IY76_9FUNG|nr:hypothetical protein BCR42DRAFT_402539 [Absidia repens]
MSSPSLTLAQQSDKIQQLSLQSPPNKTTYKKTIQQRRKKTQVYSWTVDSLQRQYRRSIYEDRLLAEKHEARSTQLTQQRRQLEQDINQLTHDLQSHDTHLQAARTYAHQRHTKYLLRQRQFHRYAKVPLINNTYKQKYLRAQKKNQLAESDVAAQRHGIDHIKDQRTIRHQQLQEQEQEESACTRMVRTIRTRIASHETLDRHWQNGLAFWTERVGSLSLTLDQKIVALQHLLRQFDCDKQQELIAILTTFRQAWADFEQAETYGEQEYSLDKVDFVCAKCMDSYQQHMPRPDKNHPTDLLCSSCYQSARTSMIIKKKLGFLHTPSSSATSTSTFSSASSSSLPPLLTPSSSSRQSSFVIESSPTPPPKDHPPKHLVY